MKTFILIMAVLTAAALVFDPTAAHAMASLGAAASGAHTGMPIMAGLAAAAAVSAPRIRGVLAARADASPTEILNRLTKTFEDFKAERNEEIEALKKGQADVVKTEKVDRINDELGKLGKDLDAVNSALAALKVGGTGGGVDPDVAAHATAFDRFFRKGDAAANIRELEVSAKLTTQSDPDGGYLVPEETEAGIDRVLGTVSTMRSLARVINISGDTYKKLVSMGGAGAGWVGEEQARPETASPTLREIAINAKELYANPAATQTLLDDARVDIAAWLADEVSIEFAEQEGEAFITGDGVLKPRGLLSYTNAANASYAWGGLGFVVTGKAADFADTSTTVSKADALVDLYYALKAPYRNGASFLMSDPTMASVRKFKDADGNFLWAPPTAAAEVATVLGKPVYTDDNMPAVAANAFVAAFGDFKRGYTIVDRFGIRVLRDPYTNKPFVHFYTTKRVGGGVTNFEAIKLLKVST